MEGRYGKDDVEWRGACHKTAETDLIGAFRGQNRRLDGGYPGNLSGFPNKITDDDNEPQYEINKTGRKPMA
jgi:hypothetical protein